MTRLLPASEVADMLGIAESTVYQWMRDRKMPCTRLGRRRMVSEGALERWIEQNTDYGDPSSTDGQAPRGTLSTSTREAAHVVSLHAPRINDPQNKS